MAAEKYRFWGVHLKNMARVRGRNVRSPLIVATMQLFISKQHAALHCSDMTPYLMVLPEVNSHKLYASR